MISFTQFKRPNGAASQIHIQRSAEIEDKARAITARGFNFEIELLATGMVSMEVVGGGRETALTGELVPNGPKVPETVDKMIVSATQLLGIN